MISLKDIISYSKLYGFIYKSSEIYGGLQSIYDYGHFGVLLKNNIKKYWTDSMIKLHDNIISIESSIITHFDVLKSSKHINKFNETYIKNKINGNKYKLNEFIRFVIKKKNKNLNDNNINKIYNILYNYSINNLLTLNKIICVFNKFNIYFNKNEWNEVENINLMFKVKFNSIDNKYIAFLRPETAQGIYINFSNFLNYYNINIPFGVIQIGKVFRNEFIARRFIFRMKEFEQMEMQFFIKPNEELFWFKYWRKIRYNWYKNLFMNDKYKNIILKNKINLPHYASIATDIEYNYPFGYKEIEGIHSRRDYDFINHMKNSDKRFNFLNSVKINKNIPFVIETSLGIDRLILAILCNSLKKEKINNNKKRLILKINPIIAPISVAIFPLVNDDRLIKLSRCIYDNIKWYFSTYYSNKYSIGKRYRKQDAIGTPLCITIDYKSIENDTVTLRYRDSMKQIRIYIKDIKKYIYNIIDIKKYIT